MLTLSPLFRDHMVLQQGKPVRITGQADPLSEVSGRLSSAASVLSESSTHAGADGSFLLELPPVSAGWDLTLEVSSGGQKVCVRDAAAGDVWMAMGQSNMEYALRYDADWDHTRIRTAGDGADRMIRMFNFPQIAFEGWPYTTPGSGCWFFEGDAPWKLFSAPGYYFAKKLRGEGIDVPIGVIGCNWGGTPAQSWIREDYLEKEPLSRLVKEYEAQYAGTDPEELKAESLKAWESECDYSHGIEWRAMMEGMDWEEQLEWEVQHAGAPAVPAGPWHHYRPSGLYHTMVCRIAPFSIKGFLWYQGESNCGADAAIYRQTMEALVSCLRETFRDQDTPFCFMQIAPFTRWLECGAEGYAVVRHQQAEAAASIPLSAVTNVMDLGEHDDIHPKHKKEAGYRFAKLALETAYGREDISGQSPVLERAERIAAADSASSPAGEEKNGSVRIRLTFSNCGEGLRAERPFGSVLSVYTKDKDSHAMAPVRGTDGKFFETPPAFAYPEPENCTTLTADYFSELTGFDYLHPIPVRDAEADGCTVTFTVDVDPAHADCPLCVSFAEYDWCEVFLHSSFGIPVGPFHTVV